LNQIDLHSTAISQHIMLQLLETSMQMPVGGKNAGGVPGNAGEQSS